MSRERGAIRRRAGHWGPMARLGLKMMFHDRAKLAGTLLGVIFATVLMIQQLGVFGGLLYKNTQLVDNADADLWIVPPSTTQVTAAGSPLDISALTRARVTDGVAWAEPMLLGGAVMREPDGGTEAVTLIGTRLPRQAGGPWALVAGDASALAMPDTVIFEESQREELGGLDLGSVRELSNRRVTVGGFTWGLIPFGPSYAFASYETARGILRLADDQTTYVLVEDPRGGRRPRPHRRADRRSARHGVRLAHRGGEPRVAAHRPRRVKTPKPGVRRAGCGSPAARAAGSTPRSR